MDFGQLLFGVFSGDMGALSVLFAMLFPLFLILAGFNALRDKFRE